MADRTFTAEYRDAVEELSAICHAKPKTIDSGILQGSVHFLITATAEAKALVESGQVEHKMVAEFQAEADKLNGLLEQTHRTFLQRGCHVIGLGSASICGRGVLLGLIPTADKSTVIAAIGTNPGGDHDVYTPDVINWFRQLDSEYPFELQGCRFDTIDIRFVDPVADPQSLARRMYAFCTDMVDQGTLTLERLVEQLEMTRRARFWWD